MDRDKKVIAVSRILAHSAVRMLLSGSVNRVQVLYLTHPVDTRCESL